MRFYSPYISLSFLAIALSFLEAISAGSVTEGGLCTPSNDHIDSSTHKFNSDCDDRSFCSPSSSLAQSKRDAANTTSSNTTTGTCTKRLCRKDEFPFGFAPGEVFPPLCTRGYFCPDNGAECKAILPAGSPCDMGRDYQCAGPKNWNLTTSEWNFNGSVCLQSTCTYVSSSSPRTSANIDSTLWLIGMLMRQSDYHASSNILPTQDTTTTTLHIISQS